MGRKSGLFLNIWNKCWRSSQYICCFVILGQLCSGPAQCPALLWTWTKRPGIRRDQRSGVRWKYSYWSPWICFVFRPDLQVSHPIDTERCRACCQGVCCHTKHSFSNSSCAIEKWFLIKLVDVAMHIAFVLSESQSSCWPTNRSRPGGRAAEEAGCQNPVACGFFPGQCWFCCRFVLWLECGLYSLPLTLFSSLTNMLQSRKKFKKAVSEHNALLEDPAVLLRYNLNA